MFLTPADTGFRAEINLSGGALTDEVVALCESGRNGAFAIGFMESKRKFSLEQLLVLVQWLKSHSNASPGSGSGAIRARTRRKTIGAQAYMHSVVLLTNTRMFVQSSQDTANHEKHLAVRPSNRTRHSQKNPSPRERVERPGRDDVKAEHRNRFKQHSPIVHELHQAGARAVHIPL